MDSEFSLGRTNQRAFTLLELSVSIAIIAIMMSGALTLMSDFAVKHEAVNAQTD